MCGARGESSGGDTRDRQHPRPIWVQSAVARQDGASLISHLVSFVINYYEIITAVLEIKPRASDFPSMGSATELQLQPDVLLLYLQNRSHQHAQRHT